jgi:hypothetical protein
MQITVTANLKNVPEQYNGSDIGNALAQVLQSLTEARVRVIVNDKDNPSSGDRLSILRALNRSIPHPGQNVDLPQSEDRIHLLR